MAHYAFLDNDNVVTEVIVGVDETEFIDGKAPEQWYGEFRGQKCLRTSYNTYANKHLNGGVPFRGNYAGIGFFYNESFDVFFPPQPFPSWKLNYETFSWNPPVPKPDDEEGFVHLWFEPNKEWIKVPVKS